MKIGVAYADSEQQVWKRIEVEQDCTINDAIDVSGLLTEFPHIDLTKQKVGIFGKISSLETKLSDGDRVEIYRDITCDPEKVPRRNTAVSV